MASINALANQTYIVLWDLISTLCLLVREMMRYYGVNYFCFMFMFLSFFFLKIRMEPLNQAKEWHESTCALHFVKICSLKDPELKEKLVEAANELQKKIQAHNKITEVARAKKVLFLQILM